MWRVTFVQFETPLIDGLDFDVNASSWG